jgi:Cellulose biosynthesis protein BcsS
LRARCLAASFSVALLVAPVAARADGNAQIFAGGQFDFANYAFMGVTVALPGSTIGSGFALRGVIDAGGYRYVSGNVGSVAANFGGGELDAVYQLTHKNFWNNFALGINDTYTGLTPYDPNNRLKGEQVELRAGVDGGTVTGPWRADWFGYYGPRLGDYEARLDGTHSISQVWRLGAEVYSEGNPSYRLYQVGPIAGLTFAKDSELQFSVGEAWESGLTPRPYVRALISQRL